MHAMPVPSIPSRRTARADRRPRSGSGCCPAPGRHGSGPVTVPAARGRARRAAAIRSRPLRRRGPPRRRWRDNDSSSAQDASRPETRRPIDAAGEGSAQRPGWQQRDRNGDGTERHPAGTPSRPRPSPDRRAAAVAQGPDRPPAGDCAPRVPGRGTVPRSPAAARGRRLRR